MSPTRAAIDANRLHIPIMTLHNCLALAYNVMLCDVHGTALHLTIHRCLLVNGHAHHP
jgi:hypothetical protein